MICVSTPLCHLSMYAVRMAPSTVEVSAKMSEPAKCSQQDWLTFYTVTAKTRIFAAKTVFAENGVL